MNEADRVIEMAAAERKAGVARFDRALDVDLEAFLEIEKHDFAARRHDIAHDALPQIERVHEQIAAQLRYFIGLFALVENEAQLFLAVRQLGPGHRFDPQQFLEKEIRRFVQDPDGRFEQDVETAERPGERERNRKRIADRDIFRRQFAEDNVEKSNPEECQRDRDRRDKRVRMDVRQDEGRLEQVGEKLLANPAQRETREGDAELGRGKVGIEMVADVLGKNGPQISFILESIQLAAPDLHDRKFRRHKKGVENNKAQDDRQFAQYDQRRIPVLNDC